MKKKRIIIVIAVLLFAVAAASALTVFFGLRENKKLVVTEYTVKNERVPDDFAGFRIVQISDFHNVDDADFIGRIAEKTREAAPDIIAVTGDLIDSRTTRIDVALDLMEKITEIAPVYFVSGNHEGRIENYDELKEGLTKLGVRILENECVTVERGDSKINLVGLNDLMFFTEPNIGGSYLLSKWIRGIDIDRSHFTVLLEHRSEFSVAFDKQKVELALTGHAHGGQIRLPLIGGLYAPGQGFFPKYDGGVYQMGYNTLIVNRGLGNSAFPFRLNNPPEIVVVTLEN